TPPADGQADALVRAGLARVQRVATGRLQAFDQADARPGRPVGTRVALAAGVLQAQLERVPAEASRQVVHGRLDREEGLGVARGTVGCDRALVGRHVHALDVHVGDPVGAAEHDRGQTAQPTLAGAVVVE